MIVKKIGLIFLVLCGCNGSDYTINLSGGYFFSGEGKGGNMILAYHGSNERYLPCEVIAYNHNENFIIAKQKAIEGCGSEVGYIPSVLYKEGFDTTYYWLISHKDSLRIGPMNKREYEHTRIKYGVPNHLQLKCTSFWENCDTN